MRALATVLALAAVLPTAPAQRAMDADRGPIVRDPVDRAVGQRAEDRLAGAPATDALGGPEWTAPHVVVGIHTQADDPEGGAYGIWAAGKDYKVSFHDGATYVPFLGADYPHNQPFRWTTTSVTVGGEELATRAAPVGRQASDTRYEYDHGGVVEAYDVLLDGLEQTFVIAGGPAAAGDLVVRGEVGTALHAAPVADRHGDVVFFDAAGDPILTYGAATAVDAQGRSAAMRTRYEGGSFELVLDGAWLASAQFPVVVDPLMSSNVLLNTWGQPFGYPLDLDVLRDDERPTDNVWICYARQVSATDSDLWVMRTNDDLPSTLFVTAFTDLTSSWGTTSCAVAYANSRVVCAFVRDFGSTRNVRWHAHHVNDLAFRTGVGALTASNNNWRVDAGGNRAGTGSDRVMVVHQHENSATFANTSQSQRRAFYVDLSGVTSTRSQGVVANPITILGASTTDCERPRVNQVADGFGNNHWCVVHQYVESNDPSDDWDVYIDIWSVTGRLLAYLDLEPNNGEHKLGPVVAGSGGRFLVVYGGADVGLLGPTTGIKSYEINTQRVDYVGGALGFPHAHSRYLSSSSLQLETRSVAYDTNTTSHWLSVARFGNVLFADMLGYRGRYVTFDNFIQGPSTVTSVRQAAASFDDDHGTFVLVGAEFVTGSHPIRGNVWSNAAIPSPSQGGFGCTSASLAWEPDAFRPSSQRIGHEFNGVTLYGAPSGSLALLAVSLAPANVPIGGISLFGSGCNLLIDNVNGFLGILGVGVVGPLSALRWGLPLDENFPPTTLHFQSFHLDPSSSVFLGTPRLSVPIGH